MQIQHAQYDRQITALVRTTKRLRQRCRETREHYFAAQVELNQFPVSSRNSISRYLDLVYSGPRNGHAHHAIRTEHHDGTATR